MTELKPCPFCGNEAQLMLHEVTWEIYVFCTNCCNRTSGEVGSVSGAVKLWNRRPTDDKQGA